MSSPSSNPKQTTLYTITDAHRITGKSRTTLQRHLKSGKLSCTQDADGNRMIDGSELARVYGDTCNFSSEKSTENPNDREEGGRTDLHHRLESVQQQLDTLGEERRRERQQLQSQIDHLQESLRLSQEGHNKTTLLLEHHTAGSGDWKNSIQALETRLANQESKFEKRVGELQQEARDKAIEEITDQPWWRLLFR